MKISDLWCVVFGANKVRIREFVAQPKPAIVEVDFLEKKDWFGTEIIHKPYFFREISTIRIEENGVVEILLRTPDTEGDEEK